MNHFAASLLTATSIIAFSTSALAQVVNPLPPANSNTLEVIDPLGSARSAVVVRQTGTGNAVGGKVTNNYAAGNNQLYFIQSGEDNTANINAQVSGATVTSTQYGKQNAFSVDGVYTIPNSRARITSQVAGDNNNVALQNVYLVNSSVVGNNNNVAVKGGSSQVTVSGDNNSVTQNLLPSSLTLVNAVATVRGSGNVVKQETIYNGRTTLNVSNSTNGNYTQVAASTPGGAGATINSTVSNSNGATLNVNALGVHIQTMNTTQENTNNSSITADSKVVENLTQPLPAIVGRTSYPAPVGGAVNLSQVNTTDATMALHSNSAIDADLRQLNATNARMKVVVDGQRNNIKSKQASDNSSIRLEMVGTQRMALINQGIASTNPLADQYDRQIASSGNSIDAKLYGSSNGLGIEQTGNNNIIRARVTNTAVADGAYNNMLSIKQSGYRNSIDTAIEGNNNSMNINQNGIGNRIMAYIASEATLASLSGYSTKIPSGASTGSSAPSNNNHLNLTQDGSNNQILARVVGSNNIVKVLQSGSNNIVTAAAGNGGMIDVTQVGYNLRLNAYTDVNNPRFTVRQYR
jgi:hypothetical protein